LHSQFNFFLPFLFLLDFQENLSFRFLVLLGNLHHSLLEIFGLLQPSFLFALKLVVVVKEALSLLLVAFTHSFHHASALSDVGCLGCEHLLSCLKNQDFLFVFLIQLILTLVLFKHFLDGRHNLRVSEVFIDVQPSYDQQLSQLNRLLLFLVLIKQVKRVNGLTHLVLEVLIHLLNRFLFQLFDPQLANVEL
jgi:hypothetical protein